MTPRPALLAIVAAAAVGCSDPAPPAAEADEGSTVFEPLTDTVDRARSVEDTLREQAEERRRRIEEAEEGR